MVNAKLRESLDAEFCQKALNAVRVAALRDGKNNEQILVHLTLSRGAGFFNHFSEFSNCKYCLSVASVLIQTPYKVFEEKKREVQINFENKFPLCESACYIIPDKPNYPSTKTEQVVADMISGQTKFSSLDFRLCFHPSPSFKSTTRVTPFFHPISTFLLFELLDDSLASTNWQNQTKSDIRKL